MIAAKIRSCTLCVVGVDNDQINKHHHGQQQNEHTIIGPSSFNHHTYRKSCDLIALRVKLLGQVFQVGWVHQGGSKACVCRGAMQCQKVQHVPASLG